MVLLRDRRAPACLDHDGLVRLYDDRGPGNMLAGLELVARENICLVPAAARVETGPVRGRGQSGRGRCVRWLLERCTTADRLRRDSFDHQSFAVVDEPEACAMRRLKRRFHACERTGVDDQRGVCARVTYMRTQANRNVLFWYALQDQLSLRVLAKLAANRFKVA